MLVRNVGHLMTNPAILQAMAAKCPEGIMDAHDHRAAHARLWHRKRRHRAIRAKGSIYIVKPKMHGPEEVALRQHYSAVSRCSRHDAQYTQDGHHG